MDTTGDRHASEPQQLPLMPLRFDDESDHPVAFALTARARRAVAPEALPDLTVVPGEALAEDPADTRPARARAMRRAGLSRDEIAQELAVDELLVRAWTDGVTVRGARHNAPPEARHRAVRRRQTVERDASRHRSVRTAAAVTGRELLRSDPRFALGLGLVAGVAELDRHAVTMTTRRASVVAQVLAWIATYTEHDPNRVRVVLRTSPEVAGDLVAHRWAGELGIERDRIAVTRWRNASDPDEVEAFVRIGDPVLAATVAGWLDVFDGDRTPADVAF